MKAVTLNVEQIRELATFTGLSVEVPEGLETDTRWNITPGHIPEFETDSGEHFPDYDGLIAYTRDLPEDQSGVLALESHGALTTD
ncbi:hypothetical protein GCQ85_03665 [Salmonella enterica subsp. enterica]|nr:hypothetical protein [Salmonella enterica subsp. enterica serovar Abony]EAA5542261.1 hypothetical protein [Salmonella enterica subsp. enterica serovar Abony]EDG2815217.1 hypothetical protein [Salmonella enterica subsp. enterica serovar Abony]EEH0118631.1 hypothetical protein [Salmonella enterica]